MFCPQEAVQLQLPVLETGFTRQELEELFSFLDSTASPSSFSEGSNRTHVSTADDVRKRKRKLSNRKSAQRSRWRKKQHMEDLAEQMNRFTIENQELKNHLNLIMNQCYVVSRENECLRSECIALLARLSDLYRVLINVKSMQQGFS